MRGSLFLLALAASLAILPGIAGADAAARGAQLFRTCAACHSLQPGLNMTGPSLHNLWGRKAGSLEGFRRYSPALKASGVAWNTRTLDRWLENPAQLVPNNWMPFPGIPAAQDRAALIAYLKTATAATPTAMPPSQALGHPDLKKLAPAERVKAIRYCRDAHAYYVTNGKGETRAFWEANLRFKTDSSDLGPAKDAPAILSAGMMGDRASVFFASPAEISTFITHHC